MHLFRRRSSRFAAEMRNVALCGHIIPEDGKGMVFEEEVTLPRNDDGRFVSCFKCIEDSSIRCAWCGVAIDHGQPITLYLSRKGQKPRDDAVQHNGAYIGCLRVACSLGPDMAGHWITDDNSPSTGRVVTLSGSRAYS